MAHLLPPFCLVLAVVCGATTAQDGYEVTFTRNANEFTLKCSDITNGVPLGNPDWYFNASHYKNHSCTEDAVKVSTDLTVNLTPECEGFFQCGDGMRLSVPRLLLSKSDCCTRQDIIIVMLYIICRCMSRSLSYTDQW